MLSGILLTRSDFDFETSGDYMTELVGRMTAAAPDQVAGLLAVAEETGGADASGLASSLGIEAGEINVACTLARCRQTTDNLWTALDK